MMIMLVMLLWTDRDEDDDWRLKVAMHWEGRQRQDMTPSSHSNPIIRHTSCVLYLIMSYWRSHLNSFCGKLNVFKNLIWEHRYGPSVKKPLIMRRGTSTNTKQSTSVRSMRRHVRPWLVWAMRGPGLLLSVIICWKVTQKLKRLFMDGPKKCQDFLQGSNDL